MFVGALSWGAVCVHIVVAGLTMSWPFGTCRGMLMAGLLKALVVRGPFRMLRAKVPGDIAYALPYFHG